MKLKFNRNLQLGYGFSILVLLAVGVGACNTLHNLISGNEAVEKSNVVMQKLDSTISIMKDAETGQRGYLLTNRKEFLEPYNGAYQKAILLINQVDTLTKDNRQQQQNTAALREILLTRLNILKVLVDKRQLNEAITAADFSSGKAAMDALRAAAAKAENDERRLLAKRMAVLNRYALFLPVTILLAVLLAVVVSVFSYVGVTREFTEKARLTRALEIKEEETAGFNEELAATNEEINASNEELAATNEKLLQVQRELAALNQSLEEKVEHRTRALAASEQQTQALNEELTAINEELAAANEEMLTTNEELWEGRERLQQIIDELSTAKGEVEKSEKLFRSIAINIPKSLITVISKDHRLIAIEGDLINSLGHNSKDYVGRYAEEVFTAERYQTSKPWYDRVLAGEQFRVERKGAGDEIFQVDFVPLRNEHDEVYAGLIIALDITDSKKAEERSAKLAAIVESSDDAIIGKTLDGIITSWNRSAERIFGYTEQEMIGQSILKLIPDDRQEEEPHIIGRLKNGEQVDHFETRRVTSDNRVLDVSLTISPIRDSNGAIIGVSKIARDISERKQDELRKSDFIGMVSHELKTPLTSLSALIQVLNQKLRKSEDTFVPLALEKAIVQVKKMSTMINGFLNISRLESGKIVIEKQQFDLRNLISEILEEAELTVSGHLLVFEPGASLFIDADRDKIGSVITNLVSNAIKYSPKGKVVTVKCEIVENSALFSITDEGMGIKAKDIDRLFERYYRVSSNHTRHISGFGIGLYLSAEIIQRHNGRIWVESESGVGSTFYFSLPL